MNNSPKQKINLANLNQNYFKETDSMQPSNPLSTNKTAVHFKESSIKSKDAKKNRLNFKFSKFNPKFASNTDRRTRYSNEGKLHEEQN